LYIRKTSSGHFSKCTPQLSDVM